MIAAHFATKFKKDWESLNLNLVTTDWLEKKKRMERSIYELLKDAEHQLQERLERLVRARIPARRQKLQEECDDLGIIVADVKRIIKRIPKLLRSVYDDWQITMDETQ